MRLTAIVLLGVCGCSFIGVRSPAEDAPLRTPLECKDSSILPTLDGIGAVILGGVYGVGGLIVGSSETRPTAHDEDMIGGLLMLAVGAVYLAPTVHGVLATHECGDAKHHRNRLLALMATAGAAAEDHDCEEVRAIETKMLALDADYHDAVFIHAPEIALCLAENAGRIKN